MFATVLNGCTGLLDFHEFQEDEFTATWVDEGVVLRNRTGGMVFYFAVGRHMAARINWAPCVDRDNCPHLLSGTSDTVSSHRISFENPESEPVLVYWWHAVPGSNGLRPGSIRTAIANR